MIKKILTLSALSILCGMSFANTCPGIQELQRNKLTGWKLFDSDTGTPLTAQQESDFKKNAVAFVLAEWTSADHKSGSIHCFYRDKDGSNLEAYLAKDHFALQNRNNYWYAVSGSMHCAAGETKCEFMDKVGQSQLAKK